MIPLCPADLPYEEYLKCDHWQTMRRLALEAAENRCILCDSPDNLAVHHRTYLRRGYEKLSDLVVLCGECHERVHDRLKSVDDTPDDDLRDLLSRGRHGKRTR